MTGRFALLLALVAAPAGAQDFAGQDLEPPVIQVASPARGEYVTRSAVTVEGTASDAGSGIAAVEVNGAPVNPGQGGRFSVPVTLQFGANLVTVRAVDHAGNAASSALSVMFAPGYLPAEAPVPLAAVARLNEPALNAIAPMVAEAITHGGALQARLSRPPRLFRDEVTVLGVCVASADVRVQSVTFDPIQIQLDTVPGGLNALVTVPNFRLQANARSYCGIPYSVRGEVSAQAAVRVALPVGLRPGGRFEVAAAQSTVSLSGFRFDIYGIPSIIENLVRSGVERELQRRLDEELPPRVAREVGRTLDQLAVREERLVGDTPIAFRLTPADVTVDEGGITVALDGDVVAPKDPATPTVPGSVFRGPGAIPPYAAAPAFFASLSENAVNRALFTSWQAGFWNLQIDPTFLAQFNVSLPFQLNSSLLAAFFPQLAGMLPPGGPFPLAIRLEPRMQPVLTLTGDPSPLRLDVGEVHVAILSDFGQGPASLVAAVAQLEMTVDAGIDAGDLALVPGPPLRIVVDVLSQPLVPVSDAELERFLSFVVPPAIQVAAGSIRPVPLPTLQGLTLVNPRVYLDGQQREFLTLEGDVR